MAESSIVLSLKNQARSLSSAPSSGRVSRWIVGTTSLREENELRILEYDPDLEAMTSIRVYDHKSEVWDVACCPEDLHVLATVHSSVGAYGCTLWTGNEDGSLHEVQKLNEGSSIVRRVLWHATQLDLVVCIDESAIHQWTVAEAGIKLINSGSPGELQQLWSGALHPANPTVAATAGGNNVQIWDLRMLAKSGELLSAHKMPVRDVDFAPHQEHRLVSCGDDCKLRFWDLRALGRTEALLELGGHSHWIWKTRYNSFYDQLLVSSSSDSLINLWHTPGLASLASDSTAEKPINRQARSELDGKVHTYDEHEESVYGLSWSTVDPWVFASLSYDGRVVINKVPKHAKYKILV